MGRFETLKRVVRGVDTGEGRIGGFFPGFSREIGVRRVKVRKPVKRRVVVGRKVKGRGSLVRLRQESAAAVVRRDIPRSRPVPVRGSSILSSESGFFRRRF